MSRTVLDRRPSRAATTPLAKVLRASVRRIWRTPTATTAVATRRTAGTTAPAVAEISHPWEGRLAKGQAPFLCFECGVGAALLTQDPHPRRSLAVEAASFAQNLRCP